MPHRLTRARLTFLFSVILVGLALVLTVSPRVRAASSFILPPSSLLSAPLPNCVPNVVSYDIVYVRAPRFGDNQNSMWTDTVRPLSLDPGADLRVLHKDCTESVLFPLQQYASMVDAPIGNGSVADPSISFDGNWVVFTYYHDLTDQNVQRCSNNAPGGCLSNKGSDIYRLNLTNQTLVRLTHQEFTPNTGNGANFNCAQQYTNCPNVGVFNINPTFVSQTDPTKPEIAFVSSRNNFLPVSGFNSAERTLQLFMMDWDGQNPRQIGYLNQSEALHPVQLLDGRLMFTSWENQGDRDSRQFNLWVIRPDGTRWNSVSGFGENAVAHHFMTQMPNQDITTVRYYNQNNNGFGDLVRYPLDPAGVDLRGIDEAGTYMPFQRKGQIDLTNWTDSPFSMSEDSPSPCAVGDNIYIDSGLDCPGGNGTRVGKVTQPAVTPGGGLLLTYTKGPANHNGINVNNGRDLPFYDGGIYLMSAQQAADGTALPTDLQKILNDPNYNEQWPRPVVPYTQIFSGHAQPTVLSNNQNTNNDRLPNNTAFGIVGTSSLIHRDTNPRLGPGGSDPDPFNASHEALDAWLHQGADAGMYTDNDIYAIRILAMLPQTDRSYPNNGRAFSNVGNERLRILGELPVRHGVLDANGDEDTSFLARIPADTPFTFQTLDRNGMVLNMAQTWHQVRPGEAAYNCGGCHAHAQAPLNFDHTWAWGNPVHDMALQTTLLQITGLNGSPTTTTLNQTDTTLEYFQDIQPILANKCAGCHNDDTNDGKLNLHDDNHTINGFPGTYYRLVQDSDAQYGLGTPAGTYSSFLPPTLTRYMRAFQSRDSLLIWKVFDARLDGRQNNTRSGDIDFTPDPTLHGTLLTWAEKQKFARWVDLGAPIDLSNHGSWGWFEDDLRPTLWASPTIEQANAASVSKVTIAAYDMESGLKTNSLSVIFNLTINGHAPGYNFAQGLNPGNGDTLDVPLGTSVNLVSTNGIMTVQIQDNAGNTTSITRSFGSGSVPLPSSTPTLSPTVTSTPTRTPTETPTLVTSPTATRTPTVTVTPTITGTPTQSPTVTQTPFGTSTVTATPTSLVCGTPPIPTPLAPAQNLNVTKKHILLDWSDADCATRYDVVVNQGSKKGTPILALTDLTVSQVRTPKLVEGAKYFWRVRACNDTNCSTWSKWRKFTRQ